MLGFLVLWNLAAAPRRVVATFAVEGRAAPVVWERTLAACERYTLGVHAMPEFAGKQSNYAVIATFPDGPGAAQLVLRSLREFWRIATMPPGQIVR